MNDVSIEEMAKWFVVGFTKCWSLKEVTEAAGLGLYSGAKTDFDAVRERYPFWPGRWASNTAVRAVVASEFPALFRFLDANAKNPEKMARAIPQVVKLVSKGVGRVVVSDQERKELTKTRKELAASTRGYRKSRDAFKTHQRSAWNVCK